MYVLMMCIFVIGYRIIFRTSSAPSLVMRSHIKQYASRIRKETKVYICLGVNCTVNIYIYAYV